MPKFFAIALFCLIVVAVWAFIRVTTEKQKQGLLEWFLISVFTFGGTGFLYSLLTGQL